MSSFTPGPWAYGIRADGSIWLSLGNRTAGPHYQGDLCASPDDARLIAASPTLLEALEECRECLLALTHICGGNPHCEEVATRARAAITLATGKDA